MVIKDKQLHVRRIWSHGLAFEEGGYVVYLADFQIETWLKEIASDNPDLLRHALEDQLIDKVAHRVAEVLNGTDY